MDSYEDDLDPEPGKAPTGRWATRLVQAAGMLAVVALGVAAVSLFPRPHPPPPVALAPPAPVAAAEPPPAALVPLPAPLELRPRIAPTQAPHRAEAPARGRLPIVAAAARPPGAPRSPCPAARLAADRLVCREPFLAAQDRRMREAYRRALAAGADRLEIDRGQARWHGARDRATEPTELARLYARRIADLEAAARSPRRPGRG